MSFDPIGSAKSAFSSISSGVNAVSNAIKPIASIASALNNLSDPSKLASAIRSISIPTGGNSFSDSARSIATLASDNSKDWRVRLTLPGMTDANLNEVYGGSEILQPIRDSDGLVFPYTPTITLSHTATYSEQALTHQNYQFLAYTNSKVSDINVNGEFVVQDWVEARYWLAAVHFLRSVTKMYVGDNAYVGNPPPILKFSAYGDYVFKNVPVVVKSFSVTLNKDCDYISVDLSKSAPGESSNGSTAASNTDKIGANARLLSSFVKAAGATTAGQFIDLASRVANKAKTVSSNGSDSQNMQSVAASHVPTNSTLSVVLTPIYSRTQVRQFNLKQFVTGGYKGRGYI